jgi:hypothetical protein
MLQLGEKTPHQSLQVSRQSIPQDASAALWWVFIYNDSTASSEVGWLAFYFKCISAELRHTTCHASKTGMTQMTLHFFPTQATLRPVDLGEVRTRTAEKKFELGKRKPKQQAAKTSPHACNLVTVNYMVLFHVTCTPFLYRYM